MAPASVEISELSTENTWTEVYYYYLEDSLYVIGLLNLICNTWKKSSEFMMFSKEKKKVFMKKRFLSASVSIYFYSDNKFEMVCKQK